MHEPCQIRSALCDKIRITKVADASVHQPPQLGERRGPSGSRCRQKTRGSCSRTPAGKSKVQERASIDAARGAEVGVRQSRGGGPASPRVHGGRATGRRGAVVSLFAAIRTAVGAPFRLPTVALALHA